MKYLAFLLFLAVASYTGTVTAQSASKLNGTSYTFVMKSMDGSGEEIIDNLTFSNGSANSEHLASLGYRLATINEKGAENATQFEMVFRNGKSETMVFSGNVSGGHIDGTITKTDASGNISNMAFRGMTSDKWEQRKKEKENYNQGVRMEKGKHE
jgi:hypothetical protein